MPTPRGTGCPDSPREPLSWMRTNLVNLGNETRGHFRPLSGLRFNRWSQEKLLCFRGISTQIISQSRWTVCVFRAPATIRLSSRRSNLLAPRIQVRELLDGSPDQRTVSAADRIADRYRRCRVPWIRNRQQLAHFRLAFA